MDMARFRAVLIMLVLVNNNNAQEFNETFPLQLKMGVLIPWQTGYAAFSGLTSASAVSIAIDDIRNDPSLSSRMNFSLVTIDSGCNSKTATGNAVHLLMKEEIDIFIGPPCSDACKPVAELSSVLDKPIISWVAADADFNDKTVYTTLMRTLGPFNKMGYFLVKIFDQYGWNRVVVISSEEFLWMDAGKAVRDAFEERNITIAYESTYDDSLPTDNFMTHVLTKTTTEGRIVVLVTPEHHWRPFMLKAYDLGMTEGDYVFYVISIMPQEEVNPAQMWLGSDDRDAEARQAFEAVFQVSLAGMSSAALDAFRLDVADRMRQPPWDKFTPPGFKADYGDRFSPYLYDAVILYAATVNQTLDKGENPRSGSVLANALRSRKFKGVSGTILLDDNGDREPDYWVTDMAENGTFIRIGESFSDDDGIRQFRNNLIPPMWPRGRQGKDNAPPDIPACGFRDEKCTEPILGAWSVAIIVISVCLILPSTAIVLLLFHRKNRTNLAEKSWRIQWSEIKPRNNLTRNYRHIARSMGMDDVASSSLSSLSNRSSNSETMAARQVKAPTTLGIFKGTMVTMKHMQKEHFQLTNALIKEFNEMKEIAHDNLNGFIGACLDPPPDVCFVWHYCSKGNLHDVLHNDTYKLDHSFKLSFVTDISRGMDYLHKSYFHSHGNLKSSNCLVDERWTVKVTDFGVPNVLPMRSTDLDESETYGRRLWTAPEILRDEFSMARGTQKGDVYSFSIVCYETMMRSDPYTFHHITPRDVLCRVRNGESVPYRPNLPATTDIGSPFLELIKSCWAENPDQRPTFQAIRSSLRNLTAGEINIMDNVLSMMEKYANNLEKLIEDRTQQLTEEQRKTDRLLHRMLPATVAEQLKVGQDVRPESYDQATIYFSDIVGFTSMAADSTPMQIVTFLNDLYSCFDDIIDKHDVYKVETIGDAYMVVSGVPVTNGKRHVCEIANVSLDLLSSIAGYKIRHRPHQSLQLRIGVHTGPAVAGVVGSTMPRYCLFGDAVNTAARMESTGKPFRIHISKMTYIALCEQKAGYQMTLRGEMSIKGKGLQKTYWLHGKDGYEKSLPLFEPDKPPGTGAPDNLTAMDSLEGIRGMISTGLSDMDAVMHLPDIT